MLDDPHGQGQEEGIQISTLHTNPSVGVSDRCDERLQESNELFGREALGGDRVQHLVKAAMEGNPAAPGQVRVWVGLLDGVEKLPRILNEKRPWDELVLLLGLKRGNCHQGEQRERHSTRGGTIRPVMRHHRDLRNYS